MSKTEIPYLSNELELFEHAINWKRYFSNFFRQYAKGEVIEVGAGIGSNVPFLINKLVDVYTCIEPDFKQADIIRNKIDERIIQGNCKVINGVLESAKLTPSDTILYIDVIEHIKDDISELKIAYDNLKEGGFLCILVPANPKDYSPFDKAIGHYRRYSRETLISTIPNNMEINCCKYLDSMGSVSSKVNKYFLKQSYPSKKQVLFWDRILIPISKVIDRVIGYKYGKSLLLVAQKNK